MAILKWPARRLRARWPLLVASALAAPLPLAAQRAADRTEYEVKAAYLFNFMQYVDWPPGPAAPAGEVVLCVAGRDPFDGVLDRTVRDRQSRGRTIRVTRVSAVSQIDPCHVLFVAGTNTTIIDAWLLAARDRPVLTVGEEAGFAEAGGMVGFVVGETVRFEVNVRAVRRAGLEVSSRVLRLATELYE